MRSNVPGYELVTPHDFDHALELAGAGWRPIAGGTDVMVLFEAGKLPHRRWFTVRALPELRGFHETSEFVTIGALTTYTEIRYNELLGREFPMLCEAARQTGGVATQNRGTIGGNIVNASPAADTPPALLAYDAEVELRSPRGSRWVRYAQFHKGYKQMDLAADELLTAVRLQRRFGGWKHWYRKVGTRKAQAISKVCFAGIKRGDEVRIGLGSVAPVPLLYQGGVTPIDDIRSTARYRSQVVKNLIDEFMRQP